MLNASGTVMPSAPTMFLSLFMRFPPIFVLRYRPPDVPFNTVSAPTFYCPLWLGFCAYALRFCRDRRGFPGNRPQTCGLVGHAHRPILPGPCEARGLASDLAGQLGFTR